MTAAAADRTRLLGAIHAEAKRLGVGDDERVELQHRLTGCRSCRDMTLPQLRLVAAAIRRRRRPVGVPAPAADLAGMRRRARELAERVGAGAAYIDAICRRQSGVAFDAAGPRELRAVIAAVYRHGRRRGQPAS